MFQVYRHGKRRSDDRFMFFYRDRYDARHKGAQSHDRAMFSMPCSARNRTVFAAISPKKA